MPTADLAVETRGLTRDFGGLRAERSWLTENNR